MRHMHDTERPYMLGALHSARGEAAGRGKQNRHDEAVVQAEVRRLARALGPYGVLRRHALASAAGATQWREGAFERALQTAVNSGAIEPLPEDFYRLRDRWPIGTGRSQDDR
jgi:hypothetical protein